MLKNYLRVAFRTIARNKTYTAINIAGLAIGLACFLLIAVWVQSELGYDRFHAKADQIHRLAIDANIGRQMTLPYGSYAAGAALVERFAEIENSTRIDRPRRWTVGRDDLEFAEQRLLYVDNSFLDIFTFPLINGSPEVALSTPYTAVLSQDLAQRVFGDGDPVGQVLRINGEDEYTVTGVAAEIPRDSHIKFDLLCSFETLKIENPARTEGWVPFGTYTYLQLAEDVDAAALEGRLIEVIEGTSLAATLEAYDGTLDFFLQPLSSIHLRSHLEGELSRNGDTLYVYIFSAVAGLILIIALVNFVNLTTARSSLRAREVGVRKTFGAARGRLISQFLGESVIYSLLAALLAAALLQLGLPLFGELAGRTLAAQITDVGWLLPGLLGLAILVGLLAGVYPALRLSSFRPTQALRGGLSAGPTGSMFRRVLVIGQFAVSIALLVGATTVYKQLTFMKDRDLGFDQEQTLVVTDLSSTALRSLDALAQELDRLPEVAQVGLSSQTPGSGISRAPYTPEGRANTEAVTMSVLAVDHDYLSTLGAQLTAGRDFSQELATDTADAVIINAAAARAIGWDHPVGQRFHVSARAEGGETSFLTVVGVVDDFHLSSLRYDIDPLVIHCRPSACRLVSIRLNPGQTRNAVAAIEGKWNDFDPEGAFQYFFLDDVFDSFYRSEERLGKIVMYFAALAVFVGCLGLMGMAAFAAERRTREIGVRRVLGASGGSIVWLLSKEFVVLVGVAGVIGCPVAYWAMNRWLESFAFRINLGVGLLLPTVGAALAVAQITVAVQAHRAARANPVDSLKCE